MEDIYKMLILKEYVKIHIIIYYEAKTIFIYD